MTNQAAVSDNSLSPRKMKKIEIVISGEHEEDVTEIMQQASIPGFTLLRNVSGMGHGGYHEGKLLYNDKASQVMFIAVGSEEAIVRLTRGMKTLFQKNSGVMFISDVDVIRGDYFLKK